MDVVREALGLLVLGVVLAASPVLAQTVTPVPPAYQGSYGVTVPVRDSASNKYAPNGDGTVMQTIGAYGSRDKEE
ncbi:MAG TPA: hypothetical protein VGZ23_09705 [bacterium]|nr:hypothetical protein [bacterium]